MALFDFDKDPQRLFACAACIAAIRRPTSAPIPASTTGSRKPFPPPPLPDAETLALLRGRIMDELSETYPAFARAMMEAA